MVESIDLEQALCCLDCSTIFPKGDHSRDCPKCASRAIWPVAGWEPAVVASINTLPVPESFDPERSEHAQGQ